MMSRSTIRQAIAAEWTHAQAPNEYTVVVFTALALPGMAVSVGELGILRCAIHVSLMITKSGLQRC